MERTDWHEAAEHDFVGGATETLATLVATRRPRRAVVVAPARAMWVFRAAVGNGVRAVVREEIVADLTGESIADLEARFARSA